MSIRRPLFLTVGFTAIVGLALACDSSCLHTTGAASGITDIDSINVIASDLSGTGLFANAPGGTKDAKNDWNNRCGTRLPTLGSSGPPVLAKFRSGKPGSHGLLNSCLEGRRDRCACAMVQWNNGKFQSAEINYFEKTQDGAQCPTDRSTIQAIMRHEFGHVFGLEDDDRPICSDCLMGGNVNDAVSNKICNAVDDLFQTTAEGGVDEPEQCTPPAIPVGLPGPSTSGDPCLGTPLVLTLDEREVRTTGLKDLVSFDIDGDGLSEHTTWISARGRHGFLAMDRNANGLIDGGGELFGIGTDLPDGRKAVHGFEAIGAYDLAAFGGNGDGILSPEDRIWPSLRVWLDLNHDGVSRRPEIKTLDEVNVASVDLAYSDLDWTDAHGNRHLYEGRVLVSVRRSGMTVLEERPLIDIAFLVYK